MQHGFSMGSLDIIGMFPNIPVKKALEVVREELENDETLRSRTKWKVDDTMKLLEISIETYFKTLGGKIHFQRAFKCTGSRKRLCLGKIASSRRILCSGRGKWMMCFSFGRV